MPAGHVLPHRHLHDGLQLQPQRRPAQLRPVTGDGAALLQHPHAPQARRRRQRYALGQVLVADAAILLQNLENAQIGGIELHLS